MLGISDRERRKNSEMRSISRCALENQETQMELSRPCQPLKTRPIVHMFDREADGRGTLALRESDTESTREGVMGQGLFPN